MDLLYLECAMGASGDMLTAALTGLLPDKEAFLKTMNTLPLPGVSFDIVPCERRGISGLHASVTVNGVTEETDSAQDHPRTQDHLSAQEHKHGHTHTHEPHEHTHAHIHDQQDMERICALIDSLPLSAKVRQDAKNVYQLIAEAEAKAHGKPVGQIHFHELGALDAVCDIVGVCVLMELLSPDSVRVSPIHVGAGTVDTAHGRLPVPAPATAELLKGFPVYAEDVRGELCTPTGAALIKYFSDDSGPMPRMSVTKIGYGMGTKNFERCNCLRAFLGNLEAGLSSAFSESDVPSDQVAELSCNIDDMTSEALGYAMELLRSKGALEVFTLPVTTKKNRSGFLLVCLCRPEDEQKLARLILRHTSTFGLRKVLLDRYILNRTFQTADTPYGPVRVKYGSGYGIKKRKPEYADLAEIADKTGIPLTTIWETVVKSLS